MVSITEIIDNYFFLVPDRKHNISKALSLKISELAFKKRLSTYQRHWFRYIGYNIPEPCAEASSEYDSFSQH
jgi:hypothetical protein